MSKGQSAQEHAAAVLQGVCGLLESRTEDPIVFTRKDVEVTDIIRSGVLGALLAQGFVQQLAKVADSPAERFSATRQNLQRLKDMMPK